MMPSGVAYPRGTVRYRLTLSEFVRESGLSETTVIRHGKQGHIHCTRAEAAKPHFRSGQREYFVGDLPDECGSTFLAEYLLAETLAARQTATSQQGRLDRVLQRRLQQKLQGQA